MLNGTAACRGPRTFRIVCGIPALAAEVAQYLIASGWIARLNLDHSDDCITLLIDGPWGTALLALEQEPTERVVVITDNPCPEYWDDLWSLQPLVLLAGGHRITELVEALERSLTGKRFRQVPHHENALTTIERQLLRHAAQGQSAAAIASQLRMQKGSVRNGISQVLRKLGFENKGQLTLYYFGLWNLLHIKSLT